MFASTKTAYEKQLMKNGKVTTMNVNEKNKVIEVINNLTHIGKSRLHIEQALITKGYDKLDLDEILTVSYMEKLIDNEATYVQIQHKLDNQAMEKIGDREHVALEQKKHVQSQKMKVQLFRQDPVNIIDT